MAVVAVRLVSCDVNIAFRRLHFSYTVYLGCYYFSPFSLFMKGGLFALSPILPSFLENVIHIDSELCLDRPASEKQWR